MESTYSTDSFDRSRMLYNSRHQSDSDSRSYPLYQQKSNFPVQESSYSSVSSLSNTPYENDEMKEIFPYSHKNIQNMSSEMKSFGEHSHMNALYSTVNNSFAETSNLPSKSKQEKFKFKLDMSKDIRSQLLERAIDEKRKLGLENVSTSKQSSGLDLLKTYDSVDEREKRNPELVSSKLYFTPNSIPSNYDLQKSFDSCDREYYSLKKKIEKALEGDWDEPNNMKSNINKNFKNTEYSEISNPSLQTYTSELAQPLNQQQFVSQQYYSIPSSSVTNTNIPISFEKSEWDYPTSVSGSVNMKNSNTINETNVGNLPFVQYPLQAMNIDRKFSPARTTGYLSTNHTRSVSNFRKFKEVAKPKPATILRKNLVLINTANNTRSVTLKQNSLFRHKKVQLMLEEAKQTALEKAKLCKLERSQEIREKSSDLKYKFVKPLDVKRKTFKRILNMKEMSFKLSNVRDKSSSKSSKVKDKSFSKSSEMKSSKSSKLKEKHSSEVKSFDKSSKLKEKHSSEVKSSDKSSKLKEKHSSEVKSTNKSSKVKEKPSSKVKSSDKSSKLKEKHSSEVKSTNKSSKVKGKPSEVKSSAKSSKLKVQSDKISEMNKSSDESSNVKETSEIKLLDKVKRTKMKISLDRNVCLYMDPCDHWCELCNEVHSTIGKLFDHLHSSNHKQKINSHIHPWDLEDNNKVSDIINEDPTEDFKGGEFFIPVESFFCALCKESIIGKINSENHMKSSSHNKNYRKFIKLNPSYENELNIEKSRNIAKLSATTEVLSNDESENKRKNKYDNTEVTNEEPANKIHKFEEFFNFV